MVRIADFACRETELMMRRSKTSVELKTQGVRSSFSTSPKKTDRRSNYWNKAYMNDNLTRKSFNTVGNTGKPPPRRSSIDCPYQIWRLSDALEGFKDSKVIEVSTARPARRNSSQILPPIAMSSHGGRASSSGRNSENSFVHSKTPMNNLMAQNDHPNELIASEPKDSEDFCHGLPNDTQFRESNNDMSWAYKPPQRIETLQNKYVNHLLHTPKNKASSLHSRSSEGSCSSAAFRAKFASRRRLSLPVTSTLAAPLLEMEPGKSPEFYKACKELSKGDDDTIHGLKRSQTAVSLRTISDKLTTSSSNTTRDAIASMSISGGRRDSLQRIEEIPIEITPPAPCTVHEETLSEMEKGNTIQPNELDKEKEIVAAEVKLCNGTAVAGAERKAAQKTSEEVLVKHANTGRSTQSPKKKVINIPNRPDTSAADRKPTQHDKPEQDITDTNNNSTKREVPLQDTYLDEDGSVIDVSILDESDEDLCDSDFREKRIIQWLVAAETGEELEQEVVSVISPSPTNGSRETAIKVIYAGD